jgi:hypothetical protein
MENLMYKNKTTPMNKEDQFFKDMLNAFSFDERMAAMEKMPVPSLTKENFWDELTNRWPGEMHRWCTWIDEYKKRVNWDKLFAPGIKFHDIPIGMQLGIFNDYTMEVDHRYQLVEGAPTSWRAWANDIREFICEEECSARQDHFEGKYMDEGISD